MDETTTTSWTHRTLIVQDSCKETVKSLVNVFTPGQGDGMWNTPLSPTGEGEPTHWISSGMIEQQFADLLPLARYVTTVEGEGDDTIINTEWTLVSHGMSEVISQASGVPIENINQIFSTVDVSEQDSFQAMDRLGLKLITGQNENAT